MAVTYTIKVAPTLDEQQAKATVDNLKKVFNDGKVDIDLTPFVETITKITEVFANLANSMNNVSQNVETTSTAFDAASEKVKEIADSLEKTADLTGDISKLNDTDLARYEKTATQLEVINVKIEEQKRKIADIKMELEAMHLGYGTAREIELATEKLTRMQAELNNSQAHAKVVAARMNDIAKGSDWSSKMVANMNKSIQGIGNTFAKLSPQVILLNMAADFLQDVIKEITDRLKIITDIIVRSLMPAFQPILDLVTQLVRELQPVIDAFTSIVTLALEPIIAMLKPLISITGKILKGIEPLLPLIIQVVMLTQAWYLVLTSILAAGKFIYDVFSGSGDAVDGTNKNLREQQKLINNAVIAQSQLLQSLQDGEQITRKEIEGQKELLKHLQERTKEGIQLSETEMKQRQQAQKIISMSNNIQLNQLKEQLESGKNITEELKKQEERIAELNKLKASGVRLTVEERDEVKQTNNLLAEQQNKQKSNFFDILKAKKDAGLLDEKAIKIHKQRLEHLKEELRLELLKEQSVNTGLSAKAKDLLNKIGEYEPILKKRTKKEKDLTEDLTKQLYKLQLQNQ